MENVEVAPAVPVADSPTPVVAPTSKKPVYMIIILILVILLLGVIVVIGILLLRNSQNSNPVPVGPTLQVSPSAAPSVTATQTVETTGTITGNLMYPSEQIPALKICAVDSSSKVETCINTKVGDLSYELPVKQGSYYVYAQVVGDTFAAYHVKCDENQNITCQDENWNQALFICYNDPACKLAFTPMVVNVSVGKKVTGITINQGWYLPCSNSECPNNTDNPARWQYYFN